MISKISFVKKLIFILKKILIVIWFIFRPKYYEHFLYLIKRKFLLNQDTTINRDKAYKWASIKAIPYTEALEKLGLNGEVRELDNEIILEGQKLEAKSSVKLRR